MAAQQVDECSDIPVLVLEIKVVVGTQLMVYGTRPCLQRGIKQRLLMPFLYNVYLAGKPVVVVLGYLAHLHMFYLTDTQRLQFLLGCGFSIYLQPCRPVSPHQRILAALGLHAGQEVECFIGL